jgi:octaprenyl-diphosphate synthase
VGIVVPLDEALPKPASTLEPLLRLTRDDMARVDETIISRTASDVRLIPEVAQHLICSGGKRFRPMLTIAAAGMCGYRGNAHIKLAASIEFMHTATLLHDDVVDESELRRGRSAARMLWGNQATVLVGDFLLGQAFKMMVEVGVLDALGILSAAAATIAEGEVMQLAAARNIATTEDEYLEVIAAKTAALFSAAAEVGPAVAGGDRAERAAFRSYGFNVGLAFQLIDDALDYSGNAGDLGKDIGADLRGGKVTLPVVLSYRRGTDADRAFWKRVMGEGPVTDGDLAHAIRLMHDHGTISDTIERARHFGAVARDALAPFPSSAHKSALLEAVEFCVGRVN